MSGMARDAMPLWCRAAGRHGLGPAELSRQQAPDAAVCPNVCTLSAAYG